MESDIPSIEELITTVLIDIQQKGFSAIQPFSIGEVEQRMVLFAQTNGVTLASNQLYMSAKQLQHCMMSGDSPLAGLGFFTDKNKKSRKIFGTFRITSC